MPVPDRGPIMSIEKHYVATLSELVKAVADIGVQHIVVAAPIENVPMLRLSRRQTLTGVDTQSALHFAAGEDGLRLSADNKVESLQLLADADRRAIFNDTGVEHWGLLVLRDLTVQGGVQLLARDQVRGGHVDAQNIEILAADARGYDEMPNGYGVKVIPGAFTVWNQQADPTVTITADLTGLAAGTAGAPVRGSGIFVSGAGDVGGRLVVSRLETEAVYSDGGIAAGTSDRISGGVFVVYGAFVDGVRNHGPVTTYGANDMVLDNWGVVDHWVAEDKITSYGPSGVGFVNFGTIGRLQVKAPIETFGNGARGFNVYTGTVQFAEFERLVTHGDGAVGIQISQPVGRVVVRRGVETHGSVGDSLVKGVVTRLAATALSIKPGGAAREISVDGGLVTHGESVEPLELHGSVEALIVRGKLEAIGKGFTTL